MSKRKVGDTSFLSMPRSQSRGRTGSRTTSRNRSRSRVSSIRRAGSYAARSMSIASDLSRGAYGRAAWNAVPMVKDAVQFIRSRSRDRRTVKTTGKSMGLYKGRFAKTKRGPVSMEKKLADFSKKGFVQVQETAGVITDGDCVYLGVASAPIGLQWYGLWQSLLRALLKKGVEWDCTNVYDVPPNSGTLTVQVLVEEVTTGVTNNFYSAAWGTGNSVAAVGVTIADAVDQMMETTSNEGRKQFVEMKLVKQFGATPANADVASISLLNCRVNALVRQEVNVQNSTTAPDATEDTADEVDACPVKGRLYTMTGYCPRFVDKDRRNAGPPFSMCRDYDGVMIKAGSTSDLRALREPPLPKQFHNCKSATTWSLNPGEVKKWTNFYTVSKPFNRFCWDLSLNPNDRTYNMRCRNGTFKMIAMEKRINLGAQAITLRYEVNQTVAVKVGFNPYSQAAQTYNDPITL